MACTVQPTPPIIYTPHATKKGWKTGLDNFLIGLKKTAQSASRSSLEIEGLAKTRNRKREKRGFSKKKHDDNCHTCGI